MSFTEHKLGNIDGLADAAKNIVEGKTIVYELAAELTDEDASSFISAALAAKEEGKSHFMFNGKDYPVTVGEDVAKQLEAQLDPVGKEDDDVDNDGDVDDSDEYLKKRRDAISKAEDEEEVEEDLDLIDAIKAGKHITQTIEDIDDEDDGIEGSADVDKDVEEATTIIKQDGEISDDVNKANDEIAPDTKTGIEGSDEEPEVKDGEEEESEEPEVKKEAVEGDSEEDDGVEGAEDPDKDVKDNVTTSKTAEPKGGDANPGATDEEDDGIEGSAKVSKEYFDLALLGKLISEGIELDEGKMKDLHALVSKGVKDPMEIAKELGLKASKDTHDAIAALIKGMM